jgi:alanine transaminase
MLAPYSPTLTHDRINAAVKQTEYAVRGEMAILAEDLRDKIAQDPTSVPFHAITNCNIGNPQQLGQQPISFLRQIASLVEYPALLDPRNEEVVLKLYPKDALQRARTLVKSIGSTGAYSHSQGIPFIRQDVADFITKRDGGYPSHADQIFLTAGASPGVQTVLQVLIENDNVGVMIPIPQYPLYTASIALCNGKAVPYYLDEEAGWALHLAELKKSLNEARSKGISVRALCVINPGNPTGNVLSFQDMKDVISFCREERLVLMADEVYQANVYYPREKPWASFKKILFDMGPDYSDHVELISFHSISKGMIGECGRRGAYFECVNIDPLVLAEIYKLASISLCPNVQGQIAVDVMVKPPEPQDESYPTYQTEMNYQFLSLQRRAEKLCDAFNQLEGVSCQRAEGSMYLFPTIQLSKKAQKIAQSKNKSPDLFYTLALLNATGVCMVPGSGFLQKPDTYHFRSTFLPPEKELDRFINEIGLFHRTFMEQYRD